MFANASRPLLSMWSVPLLLLFTGCSFTGEMGAASFKMEGGVDSFVTGGWEPDEKVAVNTIFSVSASTSEEVETVDIRSQNDEIVAPYASGQEPLNGETGFFRAVGQGRTAIEVISVEDDELIDFFTIDIAEATSARVVSKALIDSEEGAEDQHLPFGIVQGVPVSLTIQLEDNNGDILNHHDAVEISSSDSTAIEVEAGGRVIQLEGLEGSADITVSAIEQPGTTTFSVTSVPEQAVTQLTLREEAGVACEEDSIPLVADLATEEGLPVVGYPVSWSSDGGLLSLESDESVTVGFNDVSVDPVTVTAQAGELNATFVIDEPRVCPAESSGCSISGGANSSESIFTLLLLGLLLPALRRQRG